MEFSLSIMAGLDDMVQWGLSGGRVRCADRRAQGCGAVWRPDGVDGWPDKVNALIRVLKMGSRMMAAMYEACACGAR